MNYSKYIFTILCVFVCLLDTACTRTATTVRQPEFENAKEALSSGDYGKATQLLESGIKHAEKCGTQRVDLSQELADLAKSYLLSGNEEKARQLIDQSISQVESGSGKESNKLIPLLRVRYDLAYQQKNYDQASLAAQRILDIQKKVLGPNDSQLIDTYNQLIAALCVGGKCEDTEPLLKEQLEVRSKSLGPEHPHVAVSLCLLGESAEKKKDYERALKYYENALTIRRKTDPMLVRQTEKNVLRVHQKAMDQDR